jgi:hypothetical protein
MVYRIMVSGSVWQGVIVTRRLPSVNHETVRWFLCKTSEWEDISTSPGFTSHHVATLSAGAFSPV